MLGGKISTLPLDQNAQLSKDQGEPIPNPKVYRRLIGRLMYLMLTRPDLTYSIQVLSQFMGTPVDQYLKAAYKVLRYLKGTSGQGLLYSSTIDIKLKTHCDSDRAGNPDTRSVIGYCILLGDSLTS